MSYDNNITNPSFTFNWKYKNYEIRACDKRLSPKSDGSNTTVELVRWETRHIVDAENAVNKATDYCFTLCYFLGDEEGPYLHFVGNRPFVYIEEEDTDVVWKALKMASDALIANFDIIRNIQDKEPF